MKKLPISLIKCNGYRHHRSYNTCAVKTLVIGSDVEFNNDASMKCTANCDPDVSRMKYFIRSVKGMKDLADIMKKFEN